MIARRTRGWVMATTMLVLLMGAGDARAAGLPKATAVSAGGGHTCALLSDATVKCWGSNRRGELGDGTRTRRLTAVGGGDLGGAGGVSAGGGRDRRAPAGGAARGCGGNSNG